MRIGDKVRLLRGTEQGRIVEIKDNNIVEIEIEDGFVIPVLKNEIVVVARQEAESFKKDTPGKEQEPPQQREDLLANGIYLALDDLNSLGFKSFLINQTAQIILFSISQMDKKNYLGKSYGICNPYETKEVGIFTSSVLNEAKKINIQIIEHEEQSVAKKQPINIEFNISKQQLKNKKYISTLNKDMSLIKLGISEVMDFKPFELQEKMMGGATPKEKQEKGSRIVLEQTIDLHLDPSRTDLKPNEILEHQLNEFEKAFDNALLNNTKKLKIIHGIGAGILRSEIHKRLSAKKEVNYFEDADKERFGFGATVVHF